MGESKIPKGNNVKILQPHAPRLIGMDHARPDPKPEGPKVLYDTGNPEGAPEAAIIVEITIKPNNKESGARNVTANMGTTLDGLVSPSVFGAMLGQIMPLLIEHFLRENNLTIAPPTPTEPPSAA